MSERPPSLAYSSHAIFAGEPPRLEQALTALAGLGDVVAVNVRAAEAGDPVAISEDSLAQLMADRQARFFVDAVPLGTFLDVVRRKVVDLGAEANRFREKLRGEYVEDTVHEWQSMVRHLDQALFLLRGFVLQRPAGPLGAATLALSQARDGILLAVDASDNVACMDSLRFEITPALDAILTALRGAG